MSTEVSYVYTDAKTGEQRQVGVEYEPDLDTTTFFFDDAGNMHEVELSAEWRWRMDVLRRLGRLVSLMERSIEVQRKVEGHTDHLAIADAIQRQVRGAV